ncbi:MAG: hypothetical protein GF398_16375 [Chitinivibrionales bacterium]|nr:hypothetical protein [Chitinivibrionales bacterium]
METLFSSRNFKLFGLGLALLLVGYILLGQGPVENHLSWSAAPFILVVTYCVIFPLAILVNGKKEEKSEQVKKEGV